MISKTSFLAGVQCPKLLWKKLNDRGAFPEVDAAKQAIFDQGHKVGDLAKSLYPSGIEVGEGVIRGSEVIKETEGLLSDRVALYEPAFAADGGYARVDILVPEPNGRSWRIVEVKSGTSVKDENVLDVAFQFHICTQAGLTISRCSLMHINRDYVRHGDIDPSELLHEEDITDRAQEVLPTIPGKLAELREISSEPSCPDVCIGRHCTKPYSCDLMDDCWSFLPKHPVTDLCGDNGGKRWRLLGQGIHGMADIPQPSAFNAKQQIQIEAAKSGKPHVDQAAIQSFLGSLEWPLSFFDIETSSSALPLYDGTRPYQQIPFQYSLHVQHEEGGPIEHYEFLAEGHDDPRPEFMDKLKAVLPSRGTIIAYNAPFEKARLRECAEVCSDSEWVAKMESRYIDLLVPFRNFSFYHPDQHGSASIKEVLPALTDTDYSHLGIQDGNAAARAFVAAEFGNMSAEDRNRTRNDLLEYCKLDTRAMVDLIESLKNL